MIKNNLKLNIGLQITHLVVFLIAVAALDWVQLLVTTSSSAAAYSSDSLYHVSLLKVDVENLKVLYSPLETIPLFQLSDDCIDQRAHSNEPLH